MGKSLDWLKEQVDKVVLDEKLFRLRGFEEKERKRHVKSIAVTYFLPFCVIEINDKEIKITENEAKNNALPYERVEYHVIGDKTYVVVAEEMKNATDTPLDIMKRLISRRRDGIIREQTERTRCLPFNGD